MKKENKALLDEVIKDRLEKSLDEDAENREEAFKEAMDAIDRQNELDKNNKDRIVKIVEIGATIIAVPLIDAGCKKAFAKLICEFEKDYTFTTSAGKTLANLFRFK